jgi:single-strand DNA-binding protein
MANFNFNKVILGGRIAREAELKQTPSGVQVATFSIAVNRKNTNGEQKADFINCVAWRNTAEFIYKYFPKGASICIVGNLQTRTWEDNNGNKRFATEVIVEEASFVDSKSDAPTQNAFTAPAEATTTDFVEVGDEDPLPF